MKQAEWRPGKRIAIVGGGPGGVSAALALLKQGYDVRIFEAQPKPQAIGGAVLLSTPVLMILRSYGISLENFGAYAVTEFRNHKGKLRVRVPFNKKVEQVSGIKGWHYGVLRSSAFAPMMEKLPDGVILGDHRFTHFEEQGDSIKLHFANGNEVEADLLIGADGIRSAVARQLFGSNELFHIGIQVWLCWCENVDGVPRDIGRLSHSHKYQASFFPMLHEGKPGYEWWVVEPRKEGDPVPDDPKAYLSNLLKDWVGPFDKFIAATDFENNVFRWDVYNRPSLEKWTGGRVVCLGDAVHPVSPYAAYGMGMAIEDGYYLAKFLNGRNLQNQATLEDTYAKYEELRVAYVNHNVEFARTMGKAFHNMPFPLNRIRDFVFDHTPLLAKVISKDYLESSEKQTLSLEELFVDGATLLDSAAVG